LAVIVKQNEESEKEGVGVSGKEGAEASDMEGIQVSEKDDWLKLCQLGGEKFSGEQRVQIASETVQIFVLAFEWSFVIEVKSCSPKRKPAARFIFSTSRLYGKKYEKSAAKGSFFVWI